MSYAGTARAVASRHAQECERPFATLPSISGEMVDEGQLNCESQRPMLDRCPPAPRSGASSREHGLGTQAQRRRAGRTVTDKVEKFTEEFESAIDAHRRFASLNSYEA